MSENDKSVSKFRKQNKTSRNDSESESESLTVDEGVQDRHGTVGDTGVGVNLLEDLVDVGGVGLLSGLGALLLLAGTSGLLGVLHRGEKSAKEANFSMNRDESRSENERQTFFASPPFGGAFPAVVGFFSAVLGGILSWLVKLGDLV
jgi:hypothetical protein